MKDNNSIEIKELKNSIFTELRNIIDLNFNLNESDDNKLMLSFWRQKVHQVQEEIIKKGYPKKICIEMKETFSSYLNTEDFSVQSGLYLRSSRPVEFSKVNAESIGWHRESFYGKGMENSFNCWIPIRGVTELNSLRFIPNSQNLKDYEIQIKQENDQFTNQFSIGHKLGFQYSPKIIVKGINTKKAKALNCKEGQLALFSGNLIHGAAINNSSNIRFSIDFRLIKNEHLNITKKVHFASNSNPYFVNLS